MRIVWIDSDESNIVFLSSALVARMQLTSMFVVLHVGAFKKRMKMMIMNALEADTIGLSSTCDFPFHITEEVSFDVNIHGDHLYLGPVIAIMITREKLALLESGSWKDYFIYMPDRKGLLYLCSYDGFSSKRGAVSGYFFDKNGSEEKWHTLNFPYPNVIYRKTRLKGSELQYLMKQENVRMFNPYCFNKWEMHQVLSRAKFKSMPHTVKMDDLKSLKKMLNRFDAVYLKPSFGSMGNGIQKISKSENGYFFQDNRGWEESVPSLLQAYRLFQERKNKGSYLIQRAIDAKYDDFHVDYRVILQKDASQKWSCTGIIAKYSVAGKICTNQVSSIAVGRLGLERNHGLSALEATELEAEMKKIGEQACQHLEKEFGNYGDVGLDIIIDNKRRIWLLEVNILHQHEIAKYVEEAPEMYSRVLCKPLEYATRLSGFDDKGVARVESSFTSTYMPAHPERSMG